MDFFTLFRKFSFHQENEESNSSSSSLSHQSSLSVVSSVNPPTSSSHNWTHDVFPSFRGEDVRKDFLSHIQKEFRRKGITSFIDNETKRGKSIGPELIRAIRGSKIAIILLSRNYASSKWCLDELVQILKCREELGQNVMTIFYKVDPSDVKKMTGDFGNVFKKTCAGKSKEEIKRWKKALETVGTIAGNDSSNWHNEAAMIEKMATDVSRDLINYAPSSDFDGLVGMRAHMENMNWFLRLDSIEVKMIGIWGPSGIGKSTIARALFSKYSHEFQLSVFMDNIKRRCPNIHGYDEYSAKLQLQKEFLAQIINQEDIKIHHLGVAQDRLKHNRVFVILDDVDQSMQLDAMAKETGWFGPGSRIIITTQDKNLLKAHGINHMYKVDFPRDNEALEIFCMYAFGQKFPYYDFRKLASEVTQLAGKLPLGLSVMGSYLKGRTKQEWKEELPRLRTSLDGKIESILKFSYDALCDEDKVLFIYIACFFNNQSIKKVEEHLTKNFSNVRRGLQILVEKSLISISNLGYIEMHDLLARLGKDIVRKQCPGQRQFLVDARDICQALNNDTFNSGSVVGTIINYYEIEKELNICDSALRSMSCLQFLRLNDNSHNPFGNSYLPQSLSDLPRKVRLLEYECFSMTCLPSNFNPEFLVELNMCNSKLEKLWDGTKTIRNLKWMDLSYSKKLKELPDLSTATNLHELDLTCCSSLVEIHSSIGNATNLRKLLLRKCSSLIELPSSIGDAINLEELNISGCSSLVELSSSIGNATNLQRLDLSGCSSLVELPSSSGNAIKLQRLNLSGCSSLVELPSSIGNATNLERLDLRGCSSLVKLPSSIRNATKLQRLNLSGCSSLVELSSSIDNATNLQRLNLSGCSNLVELPSSIWNVMNGKKLNLRSCSNLLELPSFIGNAINLHQLNLSGCSSLVKLPNFIGNITSIWNLDLSGCSSLVELPTFIGNATNLQRLILNSCSSLVELPSSIGKTTNLQRLDLSGCSSLVELSSSIGSATNLKNLDLSGCTSLVELCSIENATNLQLLDLSNCSSLVELPCSIGNATSLQQLILNGCSSLVELPSSIWNGINGKQLNLSGCSSLVELPTFIGNDISLYEINLSGCSSLLELPSSIENATNLHELNLSGCSNLTELPSSIGNITSLWDLDLSDCSNLMKLPSSIGNLHNLWRLRLHGCLNLLDLPININMGSLNELDLTDCLLLKKFPEISKNIKFLGLTGTAIEEVPSSIKSWFRLRELHISYWENLSEFPHAFNYITEMHLSSTIIQEIAPWVKELSCLYKLVIKGCTKLVSLPQLPDSLDFLDAENCESLETLHCSFHNTRFVDLNFANCFKLSQEIRDLIINSSSYDKAILPGEKVPPHFTYRATGSSLSMKLNGFDADFPTFLRFKACFLLVSKGDVEVGDWNNLEVSHWIKEKQNVTSCISENIDLSPSLKKQLYVCELEEEVNSSELIFEFDVNDDKWEIRECGICLDY